jgi:hypothetical protein
MAGNDQFSNSPSERPVVTTETRARQGVEGKGVRGMLYWGTGAIVVIFAVIYFVFMRGHWGG